MNEKGDGRGIGERGRGNENGESNKRVEKRKIRFTAEGLDNA